LEVYRRLNVKEVWFWHNERFSLYYLREEIPIQFIQTCGYEQIDGSEILSDLDIELLAEYVRVRLSLFLGIFDGDAAYSYSSAKFDGPVNRDRKIEMVGGLRLDLLFQGGWDM
jgi:hypothetical protein